MIKADLAVSVDGYTAGLRQSAERPFGDGPVDELTRWMFETPEENADELAMIVDASAVIMGRNMFGPDRGEWDLDWRGWWGDEPPYHAPVFVLAHRPRPPLRLTGTVFHFVTGGIREALRLATDAAAGGDISIAGGAITVNQFLAAGLIDELRLHIAPVLLGEGTRLLEGAAPQSLERVSVRAASLVTHITYRTGHRA